MLLQNTVDPWSRLRREKNRVARFMGNRGVIHDRSREVKDKTWDGKRWLCCSKTFQGINRRPLFKTDPFSYSELFFLDEATAYAAGHRPCNDCRKADLAAFKRLWADLPGRGGNSNFVGVGEIDSQLQFERVDAYGKKQTYPASLDSLQPGVMVAHDDQAYLIRTKGVRLWNSSGYRDASLASDALVEVLTPKSIVQMIRQGLQVQVHESADA